MSSELRTKIAAEIRLHAPCIVEVSERAADRILALLTPPATAKLPEGVKIHHAKRTTDSSYFWVGNSTGDMYFSETLGWKPLLDNGSPGSLWTQQEDAVKSALSAPPVPRESKPTLGTSTRCSTCGFDGMNHMSTAARDAETIRSQAARIAELEAENTRLRAQYDMVEQERTRLMLGQQVPYTPAEKPDARKVAPNGRAMVEWRRVDDAHVIGRDDSCHWWYWLYGEMRWEPCRLDPELFKPCTFDGTPITETKPDPLARAVTVGELLRLAEDYEKRLNLNTTLGESLRAIFTPPQGATNG